MLKQDDEIKIGSIDGKPLQGSGNALTSSQWKAQWKMGELRESKSNFFTCEFLPDPPQFFFKERMGRLQWGIIHKIKLEDLKANIDISLIDQILDNLVFAHVDKQEIERFGESVLFKLVRILQYSIEYLLFSQEYITGCINMLDA